MAVDAVIWDDVYLRSALANTLLRDGLAVLFAVESAEVGIFDSVESLPRAGTFRVVGVVDSYEGDYPQRIMILLFDENLIPENSIEAISTLSKVFGCACLVSKGDSPDPYLMVEVEPTGQLSIVDLDPDSLDDERLVVQSRRGITSV